MLSGKITKYRRPEQVPEGIVHNFDKSDVYVDRVEKLPEAKRNFVFETYFTFLFVREPMERLLSAYRDKLLEHRYYRIDREIVLRYRPQDYKPSKTRYNTTFAEFVKYVLDQRAAGRVLDRHWIPQSELCRVCKYRYDFIGHQETLHSDANFIVEKLKSRIEDDQQRRRVANVTFPADSGHKKSSGLLQQMYATVPAADVQALYQLYAMDYALFGFEHPNVGGFS